MSDSAFKSFSNKDQLLKHVYSKEILDAISNNDVIFLYEKTDIFKYFTTPLQYQLFDADFIYANVSKFSDEQLYRFMERVAFEVGSRLRTSKKSNGNGLLLSDYDLSMEIHRVWEDLYFEYKYRETGEVRFERKYGKQKSEKEILEDYGQMSLF